MDQWIEEFLFRGRPPSGPGSDMPVEYQVTIQQQVENPFDPSLAPTRRSIGPLTPAAAAELGWDLTTIIKGLNANALAEIEAVRAENRKLKEEKESATSHIAKLEAALNDAVAIEEIAAKKLAQVEAEAAAAQAKIDESLNDIDVAVEETSDGGSAVTAQESAGFFSKFKALFG